MSNEYKNFLSVTAYLIIFSLISSMAFAKDAKPADWPSRAVSSPIYIKAIPYSDITAKVQAAIDKLRNSYGGVGGTVVLPAGSYKISNTIHMAGSPKRFKRGGPKGIILRGSPTHISYTGPEGSTIIDIPAPNRCRVSDLIINGNNIPGVIGIRYRAGYHLGVNGGKSNIFENLDLTRMDIGIWIGDEFSPDLVSSSFRLLNILYVNVGILVEGGNVATMGFYDVNVANFQDAGIKLRGYPARVIRDSTAIKLPKGYGALKNIVTGKEIFRKDIPKYAYEKRTFDMNIDGKKYRVAGGGAPEATFYNLCTHTTDPSTWVIDSDWSAIRVYTARCEGPGGVFRRSSNIKNSRFADVLMDVSAMSPGGMNGNAIEYYGPGPLFMYGGHFMSNIALGNNTSLYQFGTVFKEGNFQCKSLVRKSAILPKTIKRTGRERAFPGGHPGAKRGMYDVSKISFIKNPGFVQLPNTSGAKIYGAAPMAPPKQKAKHSLINNSSSVGNDLF